MKRKVTRKVTEEIEIKTLEIDIPIDEITEHRPEIPFALVAAFQKTPASGNQADDVWRIRVDIDTGKIEGWPTEGPALDLYCMPRDAGSYRLLAPDGKVLAVIEQNYVPNLCVPGDSGDYIGLRIAKDGQITNWPGERDLDLCEFFKDDEDED